MDTREKIVYELCRDLVGTAKADGNTKEIIDAIIKVIKGGN